MSKTDNVNGYNRSVINCLSLFYLTPPGNPYKISKK